MSEFSAETAADIDGSGVITALISGGSAICHSDSSNRAITGQARVGNLRCRWHACRGTTCIHQLNIRYSMWQLLATLRVGTAALERWQLSASMYTFSAIS